MFKNSDIFEGEIWLINFSGHGRKILVMDRTTLDTSVETSWKEKDIILALVILFVAEFLIKININ